MADESFTVTLPSNSNMKMYPANRGCNYTVKLASPINLSGQTLNDNTSWEAALMSIQYTNRFYDVRETAVVRIALQLPHVSYLTINSPLPSGARQFSADFSANNLKLLPMPDQRCMRMFVKAAESTDTSFVVYGKVTIHAGHYENPLAVFNAFAAEFNKLFDCARVNVHMTPTIKGADGTLQLVLENAVGDIKQVKLFLFTDKPDIVNLFGMPATEVDTVSPPVYKMLGVGNKTPRFDSVQSLYVYCNIVKPQHVGDTLAPLLEIAPVQGLPGQRVYFAPNPLTYIPVNRTYMDTITVEVYDEYGNPVTFPDDVENVVCRLRFRRTKHGNMFVV